MARRAAEGIPLEDAHWARLTELANQLGVPCPEPPAA